MPFFPSPFVGEGSSPSRSGGETGGRKHCARGHASSALATRGHLLPQGERKEAAPRWLFRELTRPEAAAGNECCVRRREPPRLRASVPSCCAGPRTNHRASWSATPRTALS